MDLNDNSAVLAFMCNNEQIYAVNEGAQVDRVRFASILATVKSECRGAANMLISELEGRFPAQNVLQALGILYP
jgi:hypothetical protein